MSIYSNDNIRKIVKLTTRELPHLVQKRENNGLYSIWIDLQHFPASRPGIYYE